MWCVHVCMQVTLCVWAHLGVRAYRILRLATRVFLNGSSTIFSEAGILRQTQSLRIWLISLTGLLGDPLPVPFEAGIIAQDLNSRDSNSGPLAFTASFNC